MTAALPQTNPAPPDADIDGTATAEPEEGGFGIPRAGFGQSPDRPDNFG